MDFLPLLSPTAFNDVSYVGEISSGNIICSSYMCQKSRPLTNI